MKFSEAVRSVLGPTLGHARPCWPLSTPRFLAFSQLALEIALNYYRLCSYVVQVNTKQKEFQARQRKREQRAMEELENQSKEYIAKTIASGELYIRVLFILILVRAFWRLFKEP